MKELLGPRLFFLGETSFFFGFLLLGALKPACTDRAFEIQSYLDTWIANIGQGDRLMLFNSSKL